ncbi:SEL1-like repeat protein [Candidatus Dependentiae bacterium]|nr:SEL1-like repeat protein [Candidatus Dependentiae bacterium]
MRSSILLSILFLSSTIYCMEVKEGKKEEKEEVTKPKVSNIKKIVEKSRKFNPKTGKVETYESTVDAIDVRNTDQFTQYTFKELIEEHEITVTDYLIAQITTEINGILSYDYFDAQSLLINIFGQNYLNITNNRYNSPQINFKKNPVNNQPILGLIKFYKIDSLEEDKFVFVGSDYDLYQNTDQIFKDKLANYFKEEKFHKELLSSQDKKFQDFYKKLIGKSLFEKGMLFKRSLPDKALKIFNKVIEKNLPDKWRAYFQLGNHYYFPRTPQFNISKAIEYYKKASDQTQDLNSSTSSLQQLSFIYSNFPEVKDFDKAREYAKKIAEIDPSKADFAGELLLEIDKEAAKQ